MATDISQAAASGLYIPMDIDSRSILNKSKLGLLTHTLVSSPFIQWILPARLRSNLQNDVVFVGERSLQIKEAVGGTHLMDVTSKSDFDASIMAAKAINISEEQPWEAQMRAGLSDAATAALSREDLPPQIMVLSLASKELVFLYYSSSAGQFIHYHRPLPSDVSTFERFGRNIAVEPGSRAVAVGASCDYFGVFILKPRPVIEAQMSQGQLDPVAEERFFRVEGDIISMEFLYPRPEDGDRIILLLLVSHDHTTHAVCYEWNARQTLRQAQPRVTKKSLPPEDRLPTMMIPLTKASAFMLVTTTSMTIYINKLDCLGQPNKYPLPVPDREQQKSPLWTRWARPLRYQSYNQKHDDIYLCREDGRIDYLGIGNEGEIENQTQLGHLFCDVDAAFDILNIGREGGDLLLAAGSSGDGGLYIQEARDQPRCVQKFMNWSPVTDSVIVKPTPTEVSDNITGDRLFVCSASSFGRGAVIELRHGIEAQIGLLISLEELSSARDIWIMPDSGNGGVYMLTTDPISSTILNLPANFDEEISAVDEAECGLDLNAPTLAAGYIDPGFLIQVTDRTILLGATSESQSRLRSDLVPGQSIAAAAVHGQTSLIVTATRNSHQVQMHVGKVTSVGSDVQLSNACPPIEIDYEPVSMIVENLDIGIFIFVGSGDGRVRLYRLNENVELLLDVSVTVQGDDDISKAIDSLAIIAHAERPLNRATLLCGLRGGFLVMFDISINADDTKSPLGLRQLAFRHLGHTSVKVQGGGKIGLLTCGNAFWQATSFQGEKTGDCIIRRIWITDQNNPAYNPSIIHSFAMIGTGDADPNTISESLFCIADGQLMICNLDYAVRTIPRRINLPGSAHKVAYSQHLKALVVAYSQTAFDTSTDPVKRYTRPYIEFIDPNTQYPLDGSVTIEELDDKKKKPWRPQGAAGEKISCILEWTPKKGDEEYHFIVIGTARRNQPERGRVIFLQTSRDSPSIPEIECNVKYIHKFEGPVYSIVPYGDFTLMVSTGHEIIALEPKFAQPRRVRSARFSTHSPAISISVHEPNIYLSTARESLLILRSTEDKLALRAYDRQKLDGLSHIHIGGDRKLTLASSRGGRVSLLTENDVTDTNKMLPVALCEAHLPSSVMKLASSSKPSPLSSRSQTFYGTAINGTVYRILTLEEKEWRLLRLLQDLCVRDPVICPFTPRRKRQRNLPGHEPLDFQPSHMHVDGDIVRRLLARDSDHLMKLVTGGKELEISDLKSGQAHDTVRLFTELAREVLGATPDPAEAVMRWLNRVFHVEL
ncbi:mono-functional DNA-alkylating methyl methanesulfonate N-term-domain-containing protein [Aspergillus karnatakaensis]|uniref:protein thtA n=1 Tax=Aspergillus karnatakaensis TaxID=1810916 RepID=UPI003CCD4AF1